MRVKHNEHILIRRLIKYFRGFRVASLIYYEL